MHEHTKKMKNEQVRVEVYLTDVLDQTIQLIFNFVFLKY